MAAAAYGDSNIMEGHGSNSSATASSGYGTEAVHRDADNLEVCLAVAWTTTVGVIDVTGAAGVADAIGATGAAGATNVAAAVDAAGTADVAIVTGALWGY